MFSGRTIRGLALAVSITGSESASPTPADSDETVTPTEETAVSATPHPSVLVTVRFRSSLPAEELERRYRERLPRFQELGGLLQKYYVHDPATGEWGGVYLWDSPASAARYRDSELARSIPAAYEVVGVPRIETWPVVDVLRPDAGLRSAG